jgi:protein KTI12
VEKNLVGDAVVVVDSLNYIKGYRYQMYCIAREQKTTYCVVYCNTVSERCKEFNLKNANRFSEELYIVNDFRQEELMKRMERPELKSNH